MATAVAQQYAPENPRKPSLELLVTIVGAVILFLTIVFFNVALIYHLDSKIENVRTELKADIANVRTELGNVRTELSDEIGQVRSELGADIQRVDDRLFAIVNPSSAQESDEAATDSETSE